MEGCKRGVSERVKGLMIEKGFSPAALADAAGVEEAVVNALLSGGAAASGLMLSDAVRIATALDVRVTEMLEGYETEACDDGMPVGRRLRMLTLFNKLPDEAQRMVINLLENECGETQP